MRHVSGSLARWFMRSGFKLPFLYVLVFRGCLWVELLFASFMFVAH